jgi:hypothetical protein
MTVEEPALAVTLGLSPEELLYLLESLKLPDLPGMEWEAFDQLDPEQRQLAFEVARRGLLAREVLLPAGDPPNVNPLVLAMLAPNLAPEQSLWLWQRTGNEPGRTYYAHSWQAVYVLRWQSDLGIHQFLLLSSKAALAKAVTDMLELAPTAAPNGTAHRLPADAFEHAHAAAGEAGASAAAALLQQAGLPPETASALAADMASPRTVLSVLGTHHTENAAPRLAFTAIAGPALTWLADYETAAEPQITLRQAAPGEIEQRVRAFITGL